MATPSEILTKLGINYEDLRADERQIYSQWEKMLTEDITVDKIKDFLKIQINAVEMEWSQPDLSVQKDIFLKAEMRIIKTLLAFIEQPQRSAEWLEGYLQTIMPKKDAA